MPVAPKISKYPWSNCTWRMCCGLCYRFLTVTTTVTITTTVVVVIDVDVIFIVFVTVAAAVS